MHAYLGSHRETCFWVNMHQIVLFVSFSSCREDSASITLTSSLLPTCPNWRVCGQKTFCAEPLCMLRWWEWWMHWWKTGHASVNINTGLLQQHSLFDCGLRHEKGWRPLGSVVGQLPPSPCRHSLLPKLQPLRHLPCSLSSWPGMPRLWLFHHVWPLWAVGPVVSAHCGLIGVFTGWERDYCP